MCEKKTISSLSIQEASKFLGLPFSGDQIARLESGEQIDLRELQKATARCEGVKLTNLGGGCGLYYNPPFGVSVCCEF